MLKKPFIALCLTLASALLNAQPLLLSAEALKDNFSTFQLLDTRGQLAYLSGHIPGAQRIDWKALANTTGEPGDAHWASLNDPLKLQEALQQLGLSADSQVVVYANPPSGWGEDGRLLWSLKAAGIESVQLLDGGIDAWKRIDGPLNYLGEHAEPSAYQLPPLDQSRSIETAELVRNFDALTLIDTRSKKEFNGAINFGEARGGHLPGAIHIPFEALLNADGTAKSHASIQTMLQEKGISQSDPVVTYCTAGIRSAHTQALLHDAGFSRVRNYVNGFYHWAASPELPLE